MASASELSDVLSNAVTAIHHRPSTSQQVRSNDNLNVQPVHDHYTWRNFLSFWILGLCNNYGFVVMLSAAYDIIKRLDDYTEPLNDPLGPSDRECFALSTGVLLLADTIPSLIVKFVAPFLPMYINLRMVLTCVFSAAGFVIVAAANFESQTILGVVFTSFSSGLGETSMLAYTSKFNSKVISAWSSGTGAAGVAGAMTYAALVYLGFSPKSTLLLMLIVPLIQLITFCFVLQEPNRAWTTLSSTSSATSLIDQTYEQDTSILQPRLTFTERIRYFPKLLKYILPLFTVYLSEYLINQGLFDLIFFPNIFLDHSAQYRWLQITYQIGVFVSRSSLGCFTTNQIWVMAILQLVNVVYFTFQAVFMTVPTIWIIFILVFWEGLLGGCCYANTFNRMASELPIQYKSFGMGITAIGQSVGVVLAGLLAIPIHDLICKLPAPVVLG